MARSSRTRGARQAPQESEDWREKVMANLKTYVGLSDKNIHSSKFALVASSYVKEHGVGPSGMVFAPGVKYHRPNGSEYTFQDVPLKAIVESVKSTISGRCTTKGVDPSRRREVFNKVMADLPSAYKSKAVWEDEPPPLNPNVEPTTPFSAPKTDRLGPVKSNAALIDDLARAAGLEPKRAKSIAGQITWIDGSAGGKASCIINGSFCDVRGGRLGRDHTLQDVPTCYVRDRVMDYINDQLPDHKRGAVRRAVFSDLTEAEINLYSTLIADQRIEAEKPPPRQPGAARLLDQQRALLGAIDEDMVDLTPNPFPIAERNLSTMPLLSWSVVRPRFPDQLPTECPGGLDLDIYYDCDQIRAMIKLFISTGEWTMDEFRMALGGVTRAQLNTFLGHDGPLNGLRCKAFQLCWEFFHRREMLDLPLEGAGSVRDERLLERRAAKLRTAERRAAKRRSTDGDAEDSRGGKRRKSDSAEEGA